MIEIDPIKETAREDPPANFVEPSRGVVACNGQGLGCVIWWTPDSVLEHEIGEVSAELEELGLDDAPIGISIWEGTYVWQPGPWDCPEDGYTEPRGAFRAPTAEEWVAITTGRNPFVAEDPPTAAPLIVPIAAVAHVVRNALVPVGHHLERLQASDGIARHAQALEGIATALDYVDNLVRAARKDPS